MMSLQVVAPILYWESITFSRPAIALICFGTIALFPSVLLPSSPFMWLAGMTFGYLYGFLIITVGMSIGMSLPYFIGSAFHCRIHVSRLLSFFPSCFIQIEQ
jgi:membrane protein DedA with SNARE-associated domain